MGGGFGSITPNQQRLLNEAAAHRAEQAKERLRSKEATRDMASQAGLSNLAAAYETPPAPEPAVDEGPSGFDAMLQRIDKAAAPNAADVDLPPGASPGGGEFSAGAAGPAMGVPVGEPQTMALGSQAGALNAEADRIAANAFARAPVRFKRDVNYDDKQEAIRIKRQLLLEEGVNNISKEQTELDMAASQAEQADKVHAAMSRMELRDQFMAEQQARKRLEVEEDLGRYAQAIDNATDEFRRVAKYSPEKAWADKTAGQKFRIRLAAFGAGLRGGDPSDVFNDVLQREMTAHRQMRSDASADLMATRDNMSNALQKTQQMLQLTNDERVQEALLKKAALMKMKAQMEATEAQFGTRLAEDKWAEARNKWDQMYNQADLELKIAADTMPRGRYTGGGYLMGKEERKYEIGRANALRDAGQQAYKDQSGIQRDLVKGEMNRATTTAVQDRKEQFAQRKWLAENTDDIRAELDAIADVRRKWGEDIPGVHALSRITPDFITRQFADNREAREDLKRPIMIRLRRESGAGVPPDELEREAGNIIDAMSEEDVWSDLERRETEARRRLNYLQRAPDMDAQEQYLGRPVDSPTPLATGGTGQGIDSLVLDDYLEE